MVTLQAVGDNCFVALTADAASPLGLGLTSVASLLLWREEGRGAVLFAGEGHGVVERVCVYTLSEIGLWFYKKEGS